MSTSLFDTRYLGSATRTIAPAATSIAFFNNKGGVGKTTLA